MRVKQQDGTLVDIPIGIDVNNISEAEVSIKLAEIKSELIGLPDDGSEFNTIHGAKVYTQELLSQYIDSANNKFATKEFVEETVAMFDFIKIVNPLPISGFANRIYLVPKQETQTQDLFDAYVWINKGTEEIPDWDWEYMSTKQLEIDLTDYATQDYVRSKMDDLVGEEETDSKDKRTIEGTRKYVEDTAEAMLKKYIL